MRSIARPTNRAPSPACGEPDNAAGADVDYAEMAGSRSGSHDPWVSGHHNQTKENAMINEPTHHKTTDNVKDRAHESVDRLAERAGSAEEHLRQSASEAGERVRSTSQQARDTSEDFLDTVTDYVRENPMTAVCLAFAAGSLLSMFRRRH